MKNFGNSVSHGIAVVATLVGMPFLITHALRQGDTGQVVGTSVFASAGVALKVFQKKPHPIISTTIYLFIGWLMVLAGNPLLDRMPTAGLVWHLFVMGGTTRHCFAVLWYAA